nr:acyl-CoA reductase [Bacteroidales bacterium]
MDITERIDTFAALGGILRTVLGGADSKSGSFSLTAADTESFIGSRHLLNEWFTAPNVRLALSAIARELTAENLAHWCSLYPALKEPVTPRTIGVVMAGNIPLAGFHDMLSVLITGNRLLAKTSSRDAGMTGFIASLLAGINPGLSDCIVITEDVMHGFDAVIATGSD